MKYFGIIFHPDSNVKRKSEFVKEFLKFETDSDLKAIKYFLRKHAEREKENVKKDSAFEKYLINFTGKKNLFNLSEGKQIKILSESISENSFDMITYPVYLKNESTGRILVDEGFPEEAYSEKEDTFPYDF